MDVNYIELWWKEKQKRKGLKTLYLFTVLAFFIILFVVAFSMRVYSDARIEESHQQGYQEGLEEGTEQGYSQGHTDGYAEGEDNGYTAAEQKYEDKISILMHKLEEPLPGNGAILYASTEERFAPLKVNNPTNSPYFFKVYSDDGILQKDVLHFFVCPLSEAEVKLPLGSYKIKYAYSPNFTNSAKWYGNKMLFGDMTYTMKFTDSFDFYIEGDYYMGSEITLRYSYNGNLSDTEIPLNEF